MKIALYILLFIAVVTLLVKIIVYEKYSHNKKEYERGEKELKYSFWLSIIIGVLLFTIWLLSLIYVTKSFLAVVLAVMMVVSVLHIVLTFERYNAKDTLKFMNELMERNEKLEEMLEKEENKE